MDDLRSTRRRLIQAGASAAALAATGAGPDAARARPATAADDPDAQAAARPTRNVVLIVVDTLRADHVYGDRAHTPHIDALRARGLSYTNAYPEAMPTVPARNTIISGRRQWPYRDWRPYRGMVDQPGWEPPSDLRTSFPAVFREAGFWTACATDNPFLAFAPGYHRFRRGFDRFARRGGQLSRKRPETSVPDEVLAQWVHPAIDNSATRKRLNRFLLHGNYHENEANSFAARVFGDGLALLDERPADRPFSLVLDTFQPHEPWTPPRHYSDMYYPGYTGQEPSTPRYQRTARYVPEGPGRWDFIRRMRALYSAEVTMTDHWLGVFMAGLRERGLERDTAVVLVSDHGIYLGERGWTGKISHALHPELTHVPLIVAEPRGRLGGTANPWLASTQDIAPTMLSLAGLPVPDEMDGADLSRPFRGRPLPTRSHAWGGYRNSFFIRSRRWAMIGNTRGRGFRLFDLANDRGEETNVARDNREKALDLYKKLLSRAGGRLPYYEGKPPRGGVRAERRGADAASFPDV